MNPYPRIAEGRVRVDRVLNEFGRTTVVRSPFDTDAGPLRHPDSPPPDISDVEPCCRLLASTDEPPLPDIDADTLGPIHPVSADLVGRTVAGLAIVSQLLREESSAKRGRDSLCDPELPTRLIVEWGISLAWADNPVLTFVDETLIDSTVRALDCGVSCIGVGSERVYPGDLVQLHHSLVETVSALQAPLWRRPDSEDR
ncbi:hypothetical protein [Nocardia bovistercoris]|uniref:Uncharacterized protein n=1 Tax=Nocardia bovistercoris TaxID=2785916 RepID=A0A931ICJ3_9NOCA|nr:hypothetical protein [Nocardia bovistercoris]MBH0778036.1 hypothetical protein [Nocardia bovistercoris]